MRTTLLFLSILPAIVSAQTPTVAPADAPSKTTLVPRGEPGTPLRIWGVVFGRDDRVPIRNASIYLYHTDARGYYARENPRDSDHPRLKGYLRTDDRGRYEFETIRPGSYPNTRNPGHIHYHVSAPGFTERVFEIVFEGDSLIPPQWLRDAANENAAIAVVRLERGPGQSLQGVHDVGLRKP
jgi:protocatechuate 3,4-dioxygenase beta subunit